MKMLLNHNYLERDIHPPENVHSRTEKVLDIILICLTMAMQADVPGNAPAILSCIHIIPCVVFLIDGDVAASLKGAGS